MNVPVTVSSDPYTGGGRFNNTNAQGKISFSVTSNQATTVTYSAIADGVTIDQTARVVFTPRVFSPTQFTVTGGGSYCRGAAGVNVGLSGSENSITYQLYRDNVLLPEYTVPGTGAPISFGNQTIPGTYTVRASGSAGPVPMNGTAVVSSSPPPTVSITANPSLTITQGQTIQLTASGANSYSWSTGQSTASISVSVAGPFTVTATSGSCSSVSSVVVRVNPLPCNSVVYVTQNGTGLQTGADWSNALSGTALQGALATACSSITFLVGAGLYKPTTTTDRTISFSITSGIQVYGGYTVGTTTRTTNPSSTTFSGDIDSDNTLANNTYKVVQTFSTGVVLDGLVITQGNARPLGNQFGTSGGGGLFANNASISLRSVQFINNAAKDGGGALIIEGSVNLTNCFFSQNTAKDDGAGLYVVGVATGNLASCSFSGNSAGSQGGALFNGRCSPTITNCSFSGNSAGNQGGAMYNYGFSDNANPSLINCSFSGNSAGRQGGAMYNYGRYGTTSPTLTNCILWGNQAPAVRNEDDANPTYRYTDSQDGVQAGDGNRSINPLFADAPNGNLQLKACSPLINVGDNSVNTGSTDLVGNPRRFNSGIIDMGAYEYQGTSAILGITQQPPRGTAVCQGATVTATVSVSGASPTYQWYKDGVSLGTAQQNATLTLPGVTTAQAGSYSVVITNACNSVTSTVFSLTVNPFGPDYQPLVDLYNATGGAGWTNKTGWLTGCSPCGWYGVTCTNGQVTELSLLNNNLVGTIPASLSGLSGLTLLEIGNNSGLTGGIPSGIGNLTALRILNLSQTTLGGTLPTSLGQLSQLQALFLNHSGLSGPLPASVSALTNLQGLLLNNNQLSGCFPASYTALCGKTVSFASNSNLPGGGNFAAFCNSGAGSDSFLPLAKASPNPVCAESPVSLSVTTGTSYQWNGPGGFTATTQTPSLTATSSGLYSVTVGNGSPSCRATTSVSLTVNALPTPTIDGLKASYCQDAAPVSLSGSPSGGVFTVDGTTALTFSPSSLSVGQHTVVYSYINVNGCSATTSQTVSVNPTPTPALVASGTITCAQTSVTLTAGGGTFYVFSGSGILTQSPNSGTALVNAGRLYSVTVTNASGCASTTSQTVSQTTVPPSLSITPTLATITCNNSVVSLSAVGAGIFRWSTGEITPSISVTAGGPYSVTLTGANGCTAVATRQVDQDTAPPTARINPGSATLSCRSPTVSLSASGNGSYHWSTGETTASISVSVASTYSVTLTATNGCTSTANAAVTYQNCAPTVANTIPPQSATVGNAFSYTIPATTFTDPETPNSLTLAVVGLPAGLSFVSPNLITGTPSTTVGTPFGVTVAATDPEGLTASTSFLLNVQPRGFAITGVTMLDCNHISYFERRINFTVSFEGTNGQPISLSVVNETRTVAINEPYQLNLFTDNPVIVFKANQQGTSGEATVAYNWLAYCANGNPRVENALAPQSATVGQAFSYTIPANTFTDAETPGSLTLSVVGLPAGLSFMAPNLITGIASGSATAFYSVTVTASDPAGGSVSTILPFSVVNPGGCGSMFTLKAGDWNDASVWSCGRVPLITDVVRLNHAVGLPPTYQAQALRVIYSVTGRLVFGASSRLKLGGN
ncbi:putative Ig domain-containing protein [Spirosoma profusum]|uniref:putative Ig domain-containing protein n=1 Tax=Spirosoma profusum TaxID=2771354 RepID=UPI00293BD779|nr:putative Ig domain-containing protein [Spirosoma profusum]